MSEENTGLHVSLTGDSSSYVKAINEATNKLRDLGEQEKLIKSSEKEIAAALENARKKYGDGSKQVKRYKNDLADNERAQKELAKEIKNTTGEIDKATKSMMKYGERSAESFNKLKDSAGNTASSIKNTFNVVKGIIAGYAGKKLYDALIGTNAEYEQSLTQFETLLGSAGKADRLMANLEKMGAKTPFETMDLTKATTQLLAFGTAEDEITEKLTQLGDLSMGNAEKLDRITAAYGKMLAKGKVSLEELNMFTEAGVPILGQLQTQYGITQEKLFSMISAGKIGINDINTAMEKMTSEGGQFFGMMDKQSSTFNGLMSTMSDNVTQFTRKVGEESFEYLKSELSDLVSTIDDMDSDGTLNTIAADLGENIGQAVLNIIELVKWLYSMKDIIVAGAGAVVAYKTSFALLTGAVRTANTVKEMFNLITGKTVVCKNLETGATIKLTTAEYAEEKAKDAMIVKQSTFNALCEANPYVMLASVILGVVAAVGMYNAAVSESTDKTRELIDESKRLRDEANGLQESFDKNTTKIEVNAQRASELVDKLYDLEAQLKSGTMTTDEATVAKREMAVALEELKSLYPDLKLSIDSETGALSSQRSEVEKLINAYFQLATAKAYAQQIEKIESKRAELTVENAVLEKGKKKLTKTERGLIESWANADNNASKVTKALGRQAAGKKLTKEEQKLINDWAKVEENLPAVQDALAKNEGNRQSNKKINKEIEANNKAIDELNKQKDAVTEIIKKEKIDLSLLNGDETGTGGGGGGGSVGGSKSTSGSSGSKSSSGSSSSQKKNPAFEQFKEEWEESLNWIEDRELRDDWEKYNDSKLAAYNRMYDALEEAYRENIVEDDWYDDKIRDMSNKMYSAAKDLYADKFSHSVEWINDRKADNSWEDGDNIFKAIERVIKYTDEAYNKGIIGFEERRKNIAQMQSMLEDEVKELVANETEYRKKKYEEELAYKKKVCEQSLELRKAEYEQESAYLDKLVEKRKQAKEDEDYNTRMKRLQLKLEYEHDDTNKISLQKEIDKLKEEMDDTNFERDIEKKRAKIAAEQEQAERAAQKTLERLESRYKQKMSDVNIAAEIMNSVNLQDFQSIGEYVGGGIADGIKSAVNSMVNDIKRTLSDITGGSRVYTTNNTTNYNVEQKFTDVGPSKDFGKWIKRQQKAFESMAFLKG